jgi:protein-S-isoprenylcysteine O-methyltransferase Ste14
MEGTMTDANKKNARKPLTPNAAFFKTLAGILAGALATAVLLFGAAGRLDWLLGWLFVAVWTLLKLVFIILLRWHDPDLMVERTTRHENTQSYDRVIIPIYFIFAFGTIFVAGLDGGRFHWSGSLPAAVIITAYIIYLSGNFLASWAVYANAFFSSESRLQTDRAQTVTRNGPYRYVRHPAYLAAILLWPATGPMLDSWWAVIPGLLAALTMFIRTIYEDRMLQKELPGYSEYAQSVRYRLFPKIW